MRFNIPVILMSLAILTTATAFAAPKGYDKEGACSPGLLELDHLATLAPLSKCKANVAVPSDRILRGGAPLSMAALDCLKARGVTTIVSLQLPDQEPVELERAWAQARGISFYTVPMTWSESLIPAECAVLGFTANECDQHQAMRATMPASRYEAKCLILATTPLRSRSKLFGRICNHR